MAERLVVDHAYTSQAYPNNIIVEVDGEYYLIPSRETMNCLALGKYQRQLLKITQKNFLTTDTS